MVLEKTVAMVVYGSVVGFATFAGVAIGSALGGLGISTMNIAATSFLVTLLGIAFGAFALALSAAIGRVKATIFVTVGVAVGFHIWNAATVICGRLLVHPLRLWTLPRVSHPLRCRGWVSLTAEFYTLETIRGGSRPENKSP